MKHFLLFAGAVVALALAAALAVASGNPSASLQGPPSGPGTPAPAPDTVPAPDFALPTRAGAPFRLSDHRGEVVLLNLWATWCPPCRREMPDFVELQEALGADGFTVVGVALDAGGWAAVGPFVDALGVNYPVVVDDGTVEGLYGPTTSFPTSFLIDRAGNVRHYIPGMILRPELEPLVRALLAEPGPDR